MSMILNPYRYAAAGGTLPLDIVTGAQMAYGLFELSSSYSGPCIRVRESGSNTEADIGFSGGEVDTSSITSHCGANNGFIVTWYDQSGNGMHWTAENDAHEWQICSAGTVITDGATGETVASPTADDTYNYTICSGTPSAIGTSDWSVVFRHKETGTPNVSGLFNSPDASEMIAAITIGRGLSSRINNTNFAPYPDTSVADYNWYAQTADRDGNMTNYKNDTEEGIVDISSQSGASIEAMATFLGRGPRNWGGTFRCGILYHRLITESEISQFHSI